MRSGLHAVSTSYRIPLPGPNERSLNFGVTYRDEDTDTSQSRNDRLAANETRKWHGFTRTLGLQYLAGTFEIAEEDRLHQPVLRRRHAHEEAGQRLLLSAPRLVRRPCGALRARRAALGHELHARSRSTGNTSGQPAGGSACSRALSLGAMAVDDFNQLPPELRFFAGGDRSIRGFDYQQLGTTNAAGLVIGGEYLAVGSVEFERYFLPKWGAAVFVDGGDAFRMRRVRH